MLILAGVVPLKMAMDPVSGNHAFGVIVRPRAQAGAAGPQITQSE